MVSTIQVPQRKAVTLPETLDSALLLAADRIIDQSLQEDLAETGDITTQAIVPPDVTAKAIAVAKQSGVIAGLPIFERVFTRVDGTVVVERLVSEGATVTNPTVIFKVEGPASSLLIAERTALNLLQRLCGIATKTSAFADKAHEKGIAILDTRKTTPGLRALEKYAVLVGGGTNHRFGLYDEILIKDNHIRVAGNITEAVRRARARFPKRPVEVEVTCRSELQEALNANAEKIMLDNMSPQQIEEAVKLIAGKAFIEVSGGVNERNFEDYLISGINAISIGALTHSVASMDISLEIEV